MEALLIVDLRPDGPTTEITLHHEHLSNPTYAKQSKKVHGRRLSTKWK